MANVAKKFDSDHEEGVRVATSEEASGIKASKGFINNESVLNDGQLTDKEKRNLESSACNDNSCDNPDGDDDGGNTPSAHPVNTEEDEEYVSNISIDIDNISTCTGIAKTELQAICTGGNTSVDIPTNLPELQMFITINEGATKTAEVLAEKSVLNPEARSYFLKKAQSYGYFFYIYLENQLN